MPTISEADALYMGAFPIRRVFCREELVWSDSPPYSEAIEASAPNHWWKLDEADTATEVADSGSDPLPLTREGVGLLGEPGLVAEAGTCFESPEGNEGRFSLLGGDWAAYNDAVTWECWATMPTEQAIVRIMGNHQAGALGVFQFELNGPLLRAYCAVGVAAVLANWNVDDAGFDVRDGRSVHLVGHRESTGGGTAVRLYVNGVLRADGFRDGLPTNNTTCNFRVGGYGASGANPLVGKIDHAAVYTRLLPESEILEHYEAGVYGRA